MPTDAVTSLMNALTACGSLHSGDPSSDDPPSRRSAPADRDWDAALVELAILQRHLCAAAAAAPEARRQLDGLWTELSQRPDFANVETEITRRLVAEGGSAAELGPRVAALLDKGSLLDSLAASVRGGYELVQMRATTALRERHGALLARVQLRLSEERTLAASRGTEPQPSLTEPARLMLANALQELESQRKEGDDDPSANAQSDQAIAAIREAMSKTTARHDDAIEQVAVAQRQLTDAIEALRGPLAAGDRAAGAGAAALLATCAETLLTKEVARQAAAVDEDARRNGRASPAAAAAVGGLYRDLLGASAFAGRVAWDMGWTTDFVAPSVWCEAARRVATRHGALTPQVIGELLAVRSVFGDRSGSSLVVDTPDGATLVFVPGLDAAAEGLLRGCIVAAQGLWQTDAASGQRTLVAGRRGDATARGFHELAVRGVAGVAAAPAGGLELTWSVEEGSVAPLRRRSWWRPEVE